MPRTITLLQELVNKNVSIVLRGGGTIHGKLSRLHMSGIPEEKEPTESVVRGKLRELVLEVDAHGTDNKKKNYIIPVHSISYTFYNPEE